MRKLIFTLLSFLIAVPALAANVFDKAKQNLGGTGVQENPIVGTESLAQRIGTVVSAALSLVGLVLLINIIYAGYQWTASKGNQEIIKKSRSMLTFGVIGLGLVVGSLVLARFITNLFLYTSLPE